MATVLAIPLRGVAFNSGDPCDTGLSPPLGLSSTDRPALPSPSTKTEADLP